MSPHSANTPLPGIGLSHPSGARAAVYPDGAQVFTWWPSRESEVLFMSERTERRIREPTRGGVPVIFPQFSDHGPLLRHGFARIERWAPMPRDTMTMLALRLTDSERTRTVWPHAFEAEYCVTLEDRAISMQLTVANTDQAPISFTCALHTYLRVGDIGAVSLGGLEGLRYLDAIGGGESREDRPAVTVDGVINRVYLESVAPVLVEDRELGRTIRVEAEGFADTVVWNPGAEASASYADLTPDDYRHFVCVESARIGRAVELSPGERWLGRQTLRV